MLGAAAPRQVFAQLCVLTADTQVLLCCSSFVTSIYTTSFTPPVSWTACFGLEEQHPAAFDSSQQQQQQHVCVCISSNMGSAVATAAAAIQSSFSSPVCSSCVAVVLVVPLAVVTVALLPCTASILHACKPNDGSARPSLLCSLCMHVAQSDCTA